MTLLPAIAGVSAAVTIFLVFCLLRRLLPHFFLGNHNSSTTEFHIQARFDSEIEATGENRHLGCIGEPYSLVKIDIGKAHLLLVLVLGGFIFVLICIWEVISGYPL
jgi:hypothetical protein